MNPIDDDAFDRLARDCHAQALQQLSTPTRHRLREARHAPRATASAWRGWLLGGSVAAAVAVAALALTLVPPATAPDDARLATATPDPVLEPVEQASRQAVVDSEVEEILAALDEDPGLYLWLAANDDTLPPPADR